MSRRSVRNTTVPKRFADASMFITQSKSRENKNYDRLSEGTRGKCDILEQENASLRQRNEELTSTETTMRKHITDITAQLYHSQITISSVCSDLSISESKRARLELDYARLMLECEKLKENITYYTKRC